jgi:acetoin utilization deacetylase AcuC-like enzyme
MRLFYSPDYARAGYAFDTTRKAQWIADALSASPIPGIELVEPAPLSREQVAEVHDPAYVRAVETGEPREVAESQGFGWDPGLWRMVLSSNGGAVAAARAALEDGVSGSLSSGLHHARYGSGAGYCTFNGLVIAAQAAGARSVLVLDLDAHCGGGTASLISAEPRIRQADVSVDCFDHYQGSGQANLAMVEQAAEYLPAVQRVLGEVDRQGQKFDLCLYNAGMDPFEGCPTGGLAGISRQILADRETMVFDWCAGRSLPVAFVLAGGYVGPGLDQAGLVSLHRLTLAAAGRS